MSRHNYKYTTRALLIDLRRVYREVGRARFSYPTYDEQGRFSASVMAQRFGSWVVACRAIGVTPSRQHPYWRVNLRKQRELDDAKREVELTVEKRVQEGLSTIRDQARKEVEEQQKLKVAEKEQTILAMQKQIEELKRRAEQGSQQL